MNDNLNDKSNPTQESEITTVSGRRKFLTRTGTGIVIGALPAQSVWATTLMGSIIASGAASRQGNTSPIRLKSSEYFRTTLANSPEVQTTFKDVFGTMRYPFHSAGMISLEDTNGNPYYPTLWQIISSGNGGVTLPSNVDTMNPTHVSGNLFDLSGPNDVNIHMIALYLNACFNGTSGINYPVIGNTPGQFPNKAAFAVRLHQLAQQNPSSYGTAFNSLLSNNSV